MSKVFIVGLPRTGTTSVCAACLDLGFTVAHTAFTKAVIEQADVLADAPIFCDYPYLDKLFPGAKFIYLERSLDTWVPSICALLSRLRHRLAANPHAFSPVLKHAYQYVFGLFDEGVVFDEVHVIRCFRAHRKAFEDHFASRSQDVLTLRVEDSGSYKRLCDMLKNHPASRKVDGNSNAMTVVSAQHGFAWLNKCGKISDWSRLQHPLKVSSDLQGSEGRKYYHFDSLKDKARSSENQVK